jgi:vanillate O-demethylase monooxygenase subunit
MKANQYVRNCWYVAGFSSEFEKGKLSGHKIANKAIVIWRTNDGKISAFDGRCVHKRFPLSEGRLLENGLLECAYHGLCYNAKGECVKIPSLPDGPIPKNAKLNPFPVLEQDGIVWIWPGDSVKAQKIPPPRVSEFVDDAWETVKSEPMHVPANYLLLIENLLDITHFYPLHESNIGDIENSRIPIEVEDGEFDGVPYVKTTRKVEDYKQPPYLAEWFGYDVVDRIHTHHMIGPAITRVEMRVAPPGKLDTEDERSYIINHTHTPIDERNHVWRWTFSMAADHMSDEPGISAVQKATKSFPDVVAEDLWALEKQQEMFELPDDGYSELFLKPDMALRRARQIFVKMIAEEAA